VDFDVEVSNWADSMHSSDRVEEDVYSGIAHTSRKHVIQ
jgi:hypothetical protein